MDGTTEQLGRFGHHPDPAIDYCIEVECIEGDAFDASVGLADKRALLDRAERALSLSVGSDPDAIAAKVRLRELHSTLTAA